MSSWQEHLHHKPPQTLQSGTHAFLTQEHWGLITYQGPKVRFLSDSPHTAARGKGAQHTAEIYPHIFHKQNKA